MFGVDSSEFLLLSLVALVVIGPKDLPRVLRVVGKWVGKARGIANQFRSGFDEMVRESELAELEKKWKEENDRIMREHPAEDVAPAIETPAIEAPVKADPAP
jgi:sec-independent protein translocase protein TatB